MALYTPSSVKNLLDKGLLKDSQVTPLSYEGKTIVTTKQSGNPPSMRVSGKKHKHGWWPEHKKIEAATLYAALGNARRVAELSKIPLGTIERWCTEDWWLMTLSKVRREQAEEMDAKTTKIIDKALDKIVERIDDGDYIYDIKRGKAVPVPVSARDLTIVAGTIFDKRQLIRGEATKITKAVNSEEFLEKLADKFVEFSKNKLTNKRPPETLEIEDAQVVNEV
jgi:hypothetical protein